MSNKVIFLISLLYSLLLASIHKLSNVPIPDRDAYLRIVGEAENVFLSRLDESIFTVLSNEPIWYTSIIFLELIFSNELTLIIIIFFSSFIFSNVLLKLSPTNAYWLTLFLFSEPIIMKFIIHIRQGFAMSIFLLIFSIYRQRTLNILFFIPSFIHSSFFFVQFFLLIETIIKNRFSLSLKFLTIATSSLTIIFSIGFVAEILGARQADNLFVKNYLSGYGVIYWSFITLLLLFQSKDFLKKHSLSIYLLIFYVVTYFYLNHAARILESIIPLILIAGLEMRRDFRAIFIIMYLFYSVYLFYNEGLIKLLFI